MCEGLVLGLCDRTGGLVDGQGEDRIAIADAIGSCASLDGASVSGEIGVDLRTR